MCDCVLGMNIFSFEVLQVLQQLGRVELLVISSATTCTASHSLIFFFFIPINLYVATWNKHIHVSAFWFTRLVLVVGNIFDLLWLKRLEYMTPASSSPAPHFSWSARTHVILNYCPKSHTRPAFTTLPHFFYNSIHLSSCSLFRLFVSFHFQISW